MKKIGILGSGVVGTTLAAGLTKKGYDVMIGSGTPSKLEEWAMKEGDGIKIGDFSQTARHGEMLILSVKGTAAEKVIETAGKENFRDKTVIDTTNPIADEPPDNGVIRFFTKMDESLMERLQKKVPEANFVKAFNSIGSPFYINPDFNGQKPSMFICGNNEKSKAEVNDILDKFGWETADMGPVQAARPIESLCILWCIPGFIKNEWNHAFKFL